MNLDDFNTKTTSPTLGDVEIGYISCNDQQQIEDWLWSIKDAKEFTFKTIGNQLKSPKLELNELKNLAEIEFIQIAKDYARNELKQSLDDVKDDQVFFSFKNAVESKFKKDREELDATLRKISNIGTSHFSYLAQSLSRNSALEALKEMGMSRHREMTMAISGFQNIIEAARPKMPDFVNPISGFDVVKASGIENLVSGMTPTAAQIAEKFSKDITDNLLAKLQLPTMNFYDPLAGNFKKITDSLLEAIQPKINFYQGWVDAHSSIFDGLSKYWEDFENIYPIAEQKAARVLKKYNWFVTPSLPKSFVYDAVKLGRKRGNKLAEMNALFWEYFSENDFKNLSNMVEGWAENPLFKRRIKIFRDCVATLRRAKNRENPSNVVVPTLIAQIDGVLTRFRRQKGLVFKTHGAENQLQELRVWFEAEATNQDILSGHMLELVNYILFSILFQNARYGQPLTNPFTLSRHKIMHGEYLTYGRKANTIRAFLILDFLAHLE
ncbi:MAG: hypothetical protein AB1757_06900 [Acidobacteriota bacterium]